MNRSLFLALWVASLVVSTPATAQLLDKCVAGRPRQIKQDWHILEPKGASNPPYDLITIAQMLDVLEEGVLDDGAVVVKRPDVWSQARMTKFRRELEQELRNDLTKFEAVLSARVARTDDASFSNVTQLGASLGNTSSSQRTGNQVTTTVQPVNVPTSAMALFPSGVVDSNSAMTMTAPYKLLNSGGTPFQNMDTANFGKGKLGLEPTVFLDEKKRYLDHLHEIRRVNLGDDNADRPGYSLYLVRMPVSIQPGAKTRKGHGAQLSATVRPEFGPQFLRKAFREFVVSDLVNELTPIVFRVAREAPEEVNEVVNNVRKVAAAQEALAHLSAIGADPTDLQPELDLVQRYLEEKQRVSEQLRTTHTAMNRVATKTYGIPPSEVASAFLIQNLARLAQHCLQVSDWRPPRALDVRAMVAQEAEGAYDLLPYFVNWIPQIKDILEKRRYGDLDAVFAEMVKGLPSDRMFIAGRPQGLREIFCYLVAVDAALLDVQIHRDVAETAGCGEGLGPLYAPEPDPQTCAAFEQYVMAKWPVLTFALDPVTDQQNIADALSLRRDMQLAVAYAFATGRINFNNATKYRRLLEQDSEAIALNRTVTAFAHGNESFGWRFSPRYQNQPPEATNLTAFVNQLISNGPGRNYRIKNSKLEAGQRELTAVIVMPSFLQHIRFEVCGNWFNLVHPDNLTIPTARMVWLGQRLMMLRQAAAQLCDSGAYRPGDVQRILTRIDQLESMLPLQTEVTSIPYEASQGGFALFAAGNVALAPELVGYEGLQYATPSGSQAMISMYLVGRNFSVQESKVLVGGRLLDDAPASADVVKAADGTTLTKPPTVPGSQILSREVIAVSVPADALRSTKNDNEEVVEVAVATPNGISNRLLIPVRPTPPPKAAEPKKPAGVTWADAGLDITIDVDASKHVSLRMPPRGLPLVATAVSIPPATLDLVQVDFKLTLATKTPNVSKTFTFSAAGLSGALIERGLRTGLDGINKDDYAPPVKGALAASVWFRGAETPTPLDKDLPVTLRFTGASVSGAAPSPTPSPSANPTGPKPGADAPLLPTTWAAPELRPSALPSRRAVPARATMETRSAN